MPRNRTPNAVARVTGDTLKHPERYKDRAEPPVSPLGAAPEGLCAASKQVWDTFAADMPWLVASDRQLVELTARLVVMIRQPDCPLAFAQATALQILRTPCGHNTGAK